MDDSTTLHNSQSCVVCREVRTHGLLLFAFPPLPFHFATRCRVYSTFLVCSASSHLCICTDTLFITTNITNNGFFSVCQSHVIVHTLLHLPDCLFALLGRCFSHQRQLKLPILSLWLSSSSFTTLRNRAPVLFVHELLLAQIYCPLPICITHSLDRIVGVCHPRRTLHSLTAIVFFSSINIASFTLQREH